MNMYAEDVLDMLVARKLPAMGSQHRGTGVRSQDEFMMYG